MNRNRWLLSTAGLAAVLFSATACAPMREFAKENTNSFADCLTKGGVGSVVGGVLVGGLTGNKKAGVVVGLAGMITTWATCGEAWKEVKSSAQGNRSQALANTRGRPLGPLDLSIGDFSISATRPGENLQPNAHYTVLSNDTVRKDIKLKESWKFWIPAGENSYPETQTAKFSNDVTAQQGKRSTGGKLPTPADLPANPVWYAMFIVEGEGACAASIAKMEFGKTGRGTSVSCESTPNRIIPLAQSTEQAPVPSSTATSSAVPDNSGSKATPATGNSKPFSGSSKRKTTTTK